MIRRLSFLALAFILSAAAPASTSSSFSGPTPIQQLFILKEVMPQVERVGLLWSEQSPNHDKLMPSVQRAAAASGVEVFVAYIEDVSNVASQYRTLMRKHDVQALWVLEEAGAMGSNLARSFLIKESLKKSLPLLAPSEAWVNDGAPIHLQNRDGEIHLFANKSACDAMALSIPEKYTAQTSFLTLN